MLLPTHLSIDIQDCILAIVLGTYILQSICILCLSVSLFKSFYFCKILKMRKKVYEIRKFFYIVQSLKTPKPCLCPIYQVFVVCIGSAHRELDIRKVKFMRHSALYDFVTS